jgi:hypothetical protein
MWRWSPYWMTRTLKQPLRTLSQAVGGPFLARRWKVPMKVERSYRRCSWTRNLRTGTKNNWMEPWFLLVNRIRRCITMLLQLTQFQLGKFYATPEIISTIHHQVKQCIPCFTCFPLCFCAADPLVSCRHIFLVSHLKCWNWFYVQFVCPNRSLCVSVHEMRVTAVSLRKVLLWMIGSMCIGCSGLWCKAKKKGYVMVMNYCQPAGLV